MQNFSRGTQYSEENTDSIHRAGINAINDFVALARSEVFNASLKRHDQINYICHPFVCLLGKRFSLREFGKRQYEFIKFGRIKLKLIKLKSNGKDIIRSGIPINTKDSRTKTVINITSRGKMVTKESRKNKNIFPNFDFNSLTMSLISKEFPLFFSYNFK